MQQVVAMIIDYCCWKMLPQRAIFYLDYFDNLLKAADTDINYSDYFDFDNVFTGPRYPKSNLWTQVSLSTTCLWNLTDVTLADEDTN